MKLKKTKKQQKKELARQVRVFKILWLVVPLSIVGILGATLVAILVNQTSMSSGYAELISALVTAPLAIFVYKYAIVRKVEHRKGPPSELHFSLRYLLGGIFLAMLVVAIQMIIISIYGSVSIVLNTDIYAGLASALGIAISAAITEELICRGVIFRFSEKYIGTLYAIAISALIFGLPHMLNPDASIWTGIAIGLQGGIMLALVFVVTRNLWASIGVHAGWNFTTIALGIGGEGMFRTTLTGPEWLTGSKYGLENSLVLTSIWLVVSVILYFVAIKNKKIMTLSTAKKQKHPF